MAEFKLGRIRFVWKDAWSTGTTYYRDDVITYGSKAYICVSGHTSAAEFSTDLNIVPSKWNVMADGQSWKGDWSPATEYLIDDLVRYGASLYICNTAHTSAADSSTGLEADQSNWTTYAEGLDWRGNWSLETKYYINDLVKYGGKTYVANTVHTSAADAADGLELDQSKWDAFNEGIDYLGDWTSGGTRYKLNDVVKFGASLWICTTYHTSTGNFNNDEGNWEQFVQGLQYENDWSHEATYQPGDVVTYGGYQYVSKTNHTNQRPTQNADDWDLFNRGIKFLGDWAEDSTQFEYKVGQVVTHGGYQYLCIADHLDQQPPNASYWQLLQTGVKWRGVWTDDAEYMLGDIVKFGDNSYICILGHISEGDDYSSESSGAENSRPDADTVGLYWNVLSIGSESSVLTTDGDLVYYSGNGPARLPIGEIGQVLKVSENNLPEWGFLGYADDVYYVAEHGVNSAYPIYGGNIDKPWSSIRYACEQIEKGAKKPNTRKLLEMNRQFIQREAVEWTRYQIANTISPFAGSFTFNSEKCERDVGLLIDALVWDLTHGGNVRSREAALKYVNEPGAFYILGQEAETNASITYAQSVVANVLTQTDPTINYQTLNGDNSTAVVTQHKDTTISAETGSYTEVQALWKIVTDAITAGNDDNIPARLIRTSLLKVSTGKYYETLPIIVPAETCVLGDELRSTRVEPRKASNTALTPKGDVPFSFRALDRMEPVIGDVVRGVTVTPSAGNTKTQSQEFPLAEADQEKAVEQLTRMIKRNIDFGVGDKIEANLVGLDSIHDVNYGYARNIILANKSFIQDEIIAYIQTNYPNIAYSKTKCRQDVGYIIDAVAYDLSYQGDWQSINAGKAYYDGSSGNLQIDSTEKTATLAAYGLLKTHLQTIIQGITINPPEQSVSTQVGGTAGSGAAATEAASLMDKIINIINNGVSSAPAVTYPSLSNVSAELLNSSDILSNATTGIQEQAIDFINSNFGTYKYNSAACRRDLTNIITDVAYDVALGTNYNGVFNGISYTRPTNAYNTQQQRIQTVGSIKKAKELSGISLTNDGSSASGSSTAKTRSDAAFDEIVDIIENNVGPGENGVAPVATITFPDPTSVVQNRKDAKDNLQANKAFIAADVVAYVNNNTPPAGYDQAKCARDVKYIVDALSYDILYQGTQAISRIVDSYFGLFGAVYPEGQVTETVAAYNHMSTIMQAIVQESSVTKQSGNAETQVTPGTPASGSEATEIGAKMTILTDALTAGNTDSVPAVVYPTITAETAELQSAVSNLNSDRKDIVASTIQFITDTYSGFKYNHAKCSRDIGLIIEASRFDFMLGTNFASIVAAYSYRRKPSAKVVGNQKTASLASFELARQLARQNVGAFATAQNGVDETFKWIDDIIFGASAEGAVDAYTGNNNYSAVTQLRRNKDFIISEVQSYVNEYFKDTVTNTDETSDLITISDTSWLSQGLAIEFETPDDSTNAVTDAGLVAGTTYYVKDIMSPTTFTISATADGAAFGLETSTAGQFVVKADYEYSVAACTRDVTAYIDAIIDDLIYPQEFDRRFANNYRPSSSYTIIEQHYPGNYRSRLAARYYINSVIGSQEEDFFYLRNGTGLRMMTMDGLQGDLGPANAYGTRRPTAGAYASLDPGWGPDDSRAWISARSPYVQNCTTFGYAAVGQKIDGALHNGGNDSIVSNDFTQVISDGIGAWITNNGRAELVSVFTYYSHVGYLAENGGRVRATNGNNSYGDFGSVAECVDEEETPVSAVVDNAGQYNATISNVETDTAQLLSVEYSHAGQDYNRAEIEIFGPGTGEKLIANEFRDGAVSQCRILDIDDSSGEAGGSSYLITANTAQAGATTSITLSATDGNPSTAYPGMKVYVTGGAGAGQYALIDTYNSGSKVATVIKDSDGTAGWDHIVPGITIVAPNSSSTYQIEPAVSFTAASNSSAAVTLASSKTFTDLEYIETAVEFTGVASTSTTDGSGATFDVQKVGTKYFVILNDGGQDYNRLDVLTIDGSLVGGTSSTHDISITLSTVNAVTGAVIDFDHTGDASGGQFVALTNDASGAFQRSVDGTNWVDDTIGNPGTGTWGAVSSGLMFDGSSDFAPSKVVATCTGSTVVGISDDANTWSLTSFPAGVTVTSGTGKTDVAFGTVFDSGIERFVLISDADRDIATSDNGSTFTRRVDALPSTGFTSICHGAGKWLAIKRGSDATAYSTDGITWTTGTLPSSSNWEDVTFGNGRFIAISSADRKSAYSLDGITWVAVTLPDDGSGGNVAYNKIAYGQGQFAITNTTIADRIDYSDYGLVWNSYTSATIAGTGHTAIAFGGPQRLPKFVAVGPGSTNAGISAVLPVKARGRVGVASEKIFEVRMTEPGMGYVSAPTITITDPNNVNDAQFTVRLSNGALANPNFVSRGSAFQTASAEVVSAGSNGSADFFQTGSFIAVKRLTERPVAGANVEFASLPGTYFKLVNVVTFLGSNDGSYTAFLQVSPQMTETQAPPDGDAVTLRIRYSQVRLTGHDFLDIGTGNFTKTNYPGTPTVLPDQTDETKSLNGGRVFFTSTDQDGNFRVGDLFTIEQSTGVATLNAEAFNIAGLQELTLGEVTLGGNSAAVSEFSTDPFFTANSDSVVPTQRAVKSYIESQIGGGGASLNVNSVTAGDIFIGTNEITTLASEVINIKANVNFSGTVLGYPLAVQYLLRG